MGQPPITDYRSTSSMPPLAAILAGAGAAGHDDGGDTLMDESNAVIDFIRASKLEAFKDAFVKLIARRLASCDLIALCRSRSVMAPSPAPSATVIRTPGPCPQIL
jgi:hypothetical protein